MTGRTIEETTERKIEERAGGTIEGMMGGTVVLFSGVICTKIGRCSYHETYG
jgi:hypothetical protein